MAGTGEAIPMSGGEAAASRVDLYSHVGCWGGEAAIAWLTEARIPFRVHDIGQDPAARAAWRSLGAPPSPVVVVDGHILLGFDAKTVQALLAGGAA